MRKFKLFFQGIIVGIGGTAPGLSGSVLMVILGLYSKAINAIATIFQNFKKNLLFLLPLGAGMLVGIVAFSRLINFSLAHFEVPTRLAFFGLLLGTIPLFYREVKRHRRPSKYHYIAMAVAFLLGFYFLTFSDAPIHFIDLNLFQAFMLGFIGATATVIPGIDGASLMSALGLYGNWLDLTSLTDIRLAIYIPAALGGLAGLFLLSNLINRLLKRNHTATFAILFGFFLSIIPSVLKDNDGTFIDLGFNAPTFIGFVLLAVGVGVSYYFGKLNQDKDLLPSPEPTPKATAKQK
jgi:putative membrane protein